MLMVLNETWTFCWVSLHIYTVSVFYLLCLVICTVLSFQFKEKKNEKNKTGEQCHFNRVGLLTKIFLLPKEEYRPFNPPFPLRKCWLRIFYSPRFNSEESLCVIGLSAELKPGAGESLFFFFRVNLLEVNVDNVVNLNFIF